jgi:hypothetical protein
MIRKSINLERVVDVLNELHRRDPGAMNLLTAMGFHCSEALADYPDVLVAVNETDDAPSDKPYALSALAVINALFGLDEQSRPAIRSIERDGPPFYVDAGVDKAEVEPYTPDEQRVAHYLVALTDGAVGAGSDPIGFLITSHDDLRKTNVRNQAAIDRVFRFLKESIDNLGFEPEPIHADASVIHVLYEAYKMVVDFHTRYRTAVGKVMTPDQSTLITTTLLNSLEDASPLETLASPITQSPAIWLTRWRMKRKGISRDRTNDFHPVDRQALGR